jgi:hypothetical protein
LNWFELAIKGQSHYEAMSQQRLVLVVVVLILILGGLGLSDFV